MSSAPEAGGGDGATGPDPLLGPPGRGQLRRQQRRRRHRDQAAEAAGPLGECVAWRSATASGRWSAAARVGSLRPGQLAISRGRVLHHPPGQALKSGLGLLGGVVLLSLGALLTFVPLYGRPQRVGPRDQVFMARKATDAAASARKPRGRHPRFAGGDEPVSLPSIGKVELLAFLPRGRKQVVLADRPNHTYSAVIQARARSFVLLDPVDKATGWPGGPASSPAWPAKGSPISRVQWIKARRPRRPRRPQPLPARGGRPVHLDALPLQSYLRLTHTATR